jgi:hypothetical protein
MMKKTLISITLFLIINSNSNGQIQLVKFESYECQHRFNVGYNFNESLASPYSAGITVVEKTLKDEQLNILVALYGNCAFGDTSAILIISDTIELLYGARFIPSSDPNDPMPDEIEIALCDCCLNFRYILNGLNNKTNYVISVRNMVFEYAAIPFDVVFNDSRSLYYPQNLKESRKLFREFVDTSIYSYSLLSQLYEKLSIRFSHQQWEAITKEINDTWKMFIYSEKAIRDPFIKKRVDKKFYNAQIQKFENTTDSISFELKKHYLRLDTLGVSTGFIRTELVID